MAAFSNLSSIGPSKSYGNEGTFGPGSSFLGAMVLDTQRYQELTRRESYFLCTQHNGKAYDFDGRMLQQGSSLAYGMPLIGGAPVPHARLISLRERRPSFPSRIGRVICNAYTTLIFGEDRFPDILCEEDEDTQDFFQCLAEESELAAKMVLVSNRSGSMGSSAVSWCYRDGLPRVSVHNTRNIYVHKWEDRELLIPSHASEVWRYTRDLPDPKRGGKLTTFTFWRRRDWTRDADVVFKPVRFDPAKPQDPAQLWEPDEERSVIHGDGRCHLEWVQNTLGDDPDGETDYEGLYDQMDEYDVIWSVVTKSLKLNGDATLMLKMDPDMLERASVKKGSANALAVGENGDAKYLELSGESVKAMIEGLKGMRREILEQAQCIVPDPSEVAAQGVSSVAIKAMFAPMTGRANLKRTQLFRPIRRVLEALTTVARKKMSKSASFGAPDQDPDEQDVEPGVPLLPPRVVKEAPPPSEVNEDGEVEESDEKQVAKLVPRDPGKGRRCKLDPKPYFPATPQDISTAATTYSTATAGEAFMDAESAAEEFAKVAGIDPQRAVQRLKGDKAKADQKEQDAADAQNEAMKKAPMFGGAKPGAPPGGPPKPGAPPAFGGAKPEDPDPDEKEK